MKLLFAIVLAVGYLTGGAVASASSGASRSAEPIPAPLPPSQPPHSWTHDSEPVHQRDRDANCGRKRACVADAAPERDRRRTRSRRAVTQNPFNRRGSTLNGPLQVPKARPSATPRCGPSPGVLAPPPLVTFSDRLTQCCTTVGRQLLARAGQISILLICAND